MGDPKKLKKTYSTPKHPWNEEAIASEKKIKNEYGLRNKKEIYKASSFLKKYKDLSKKLIAQQDSPTKNKEKEQILKKLQELGLLSANAKLDDILGLQLNDILQRRLQSVVVRKNLARTMKQARQLITHRHIMVKNNELTAPSYLVSSEEENFVFYKPNSSFNSEDHPERVGLISIPVKEDKKEEKEVKKTVPKGKKKESLKEPEKVKIEEPLLEEE